MDLKAEKLQLIQQLIQVNDEELLIAVKSLLNFGLRHQKPSEANDFWNELNEDQQKSVERSIRQLEEGGGIPHEEVMKSFEILAKKS